MVDNFSLKIISFFETRFPKKSADPKCLQVDFGFSSLLFARKCVSHFLLFGFLKEFLEACKALHTKYNSQKSVPFAWLFTIYHILSLAISAVCLLKIVLSPYTTHQAPSWLDCKQNQHIKVPLWEVCQNATTHLVGELCEWQNPE